MLTKLTNAFIALVNNDPRFADGRAAKISDINAFGDFLRRTSIFEADRYTVFVTQTGGVVTPTLSVLGCSCVSGSGSCPTCLVTPCAYTCKSAISTFTQTGTGTYSLVLNPTQYDPFNEIDVQIGNLPVVGWVTVTKTDTYTFQIKTYNSAGTLASNLFNRTKMTISFYGKGAINYTT